MTNIIDKLHEMNDDGQLPEGKPDYSEKEHKDYVEGLSKDDYPNMASDFPGIEKAQNGIELEEPEKYSVTGLLKSTFGEPERHPDEDMNKRYIGGCDPAVENPDVTVIGKYDMARVISDAIESDKTHDPAGRKINELGSNALTIEEAAAEMQKWRDEALVKENVVKREVVSMIDPKDFEKHGFTLQQRNKSTDPFIYRKWIMIREAPGQECNWEDHGYCVQVVMLMPMGKTFIKMMGPEHVFYPDRAKPRAEELPCHFDGVLLNAKELDETLERCFLREPLFDFNPSQEVPHQNFWVEIALSQVNNPPKIN